jgi:ankyrin repeat protein
MEIDDGGSFLCTAVARGDSDYLKRLLSNGMDPNLKDYDYRTPLHVAASEGLIFMAKLLLEAGASVFIKDRYCSLILILHVHTNMTREPFHTCFPLKNKEMCLFKAGLVQ